jgi:hypothetical protein
MRRPVKAGSIRVTAGLRLLRGRLRETRQARGEAFVRWREAVRLQRPTPTIQCRAELIQNTPI